MSEIKLVEENKMFGGWVKRYSHQSTTLNCEMIFAIFLPAQAESKKVPSLYYLSGLTCNDQNVITKAGAQQYCAQTGIAFVAPDTSPRGVNIPGEDDSYDFGSGAGFYVNATVEPWAKHYKMYDYIVKELPAIIEANFNVTTAKSITGHSMGGHGALMIALKNPGMYKSVSAFSPIVAPTQCPWGTKALTGYLGDDQKAWEEYDTCCLIAKASEKLPLLVDQGLADKFLDEQLKSHLLKEACEKAGHSLTLRMQEGYDHSYYFIATFIEEHIKHHSKALNA
jgi:S-formylglutathione hydrolase